MKALKPEGRNTVRRVGLFAAIAAAIAAAILAFVGDASATTTPTITSKPKTPTNQRSATFAFKGGTDAVSFKCKLDGSVYAACTSPRAYASLAEGTHVFSVKAFDANGVASTPASATWRIDLTPPPAPSLTGLPSTTSSTNVHFAVSDAEAGVKLKCKLDSASAAGCPAGRAYWALGEGTHTLTASALDAAGNTSSTSATWTVAYAPMPSSTCGRGGDAPPIEHMIVIVLENRNLSDVIGSAGSTAAKNAPFQNLLAARCGLATKYYAITHPSLPNYMAMTAGQTLFASDCNTCSYDGPSVFSQLDDAGLGWKTYAEEMPSACSAQDLRSVNYIRHHNPPVYFSRLASTCPADDVPLGTTDGGNLADDLAAGALPALAYIVPNNCNNSHDACTGTSNAVAQGDHWLASWIPRIFSSEPYQSGNAVVFVTWDEGRGGSAGEDCLALRANDCNVELLALNPYIAAGARDTRPSSHYDLLRTAEDLYGLDPIGHAADVGTSSIVADFLG